MRLTTTALLLLCVGCGGCQKEPADVALNRERGLLRHQYFVECMKLLPAGPVATKYNDWDEVVEACSSQAWYQSNGAMPDGYVPPALANNATTEVE